jgi:hypothetical protein
VAHKISILRTLTLITSQILLSPQSSATMVISYTFSFFLDAEAVKILESSLKTIDVKYSKGFMKCEEFTA